MRRFTSEFVGAGHPDKLCDQISDAVLDACLDQDPESRVALETAVKAGLRDGKWFTDDDETYLENCGENRTKSGTVNLVGEITTRAEFDIEALVRGTIRNIGYRSAEEGIDPERCVIRTHITTQSQDIARGVNISQCHEQGAGDQGMMYGFACDETRELMPMSYILARNLIDRLNEYRRSGAAPWLRPDCKSQVTIRMEEEGEFYLENVTLAAQHDEDVGYEELRIVLMEDVILKASKGLGFSHMESQNINGTGRFEIGGPLGDSGVTGRKIIVDTYGGRIPHGGGAFSGKDPSKVDRSGHYMMRHMAKSVVANGLARKCQVRVAYTIGKAEPDDFEVMTDKGESYDNELAVRLREIFDLRPRAIIERFDLKRPIYLVTASGGHFGREPVDGYFPWETVTDIS